MYKKEKIIIIFTLFILQPIYLISFDIQWADKVLEYSSQLSNRQFSAEQILGKPSVMPDYGISPCAWTPKLADNPKEDWIIVGFSTPLFVQQIAIAENYNPGTISKVFLYDSVYNEFLVFNKILGKTPTSPGRMTNIFIEKTNYRVVALKLVLMTSKVDGINQIDAVAISDSKVAITHEINIAKGSNIKFSPENLGGLINSPYHELGPVISPDGKTLYFTRDKHPENTGINLKQDIWYSEVKENNEFSEPKKFDYPINNESNNFAISITPDGNSLLLGNVYKPTSAAEQGVSISHFNGDTWTFPEKLIIEDFYNYNKHTAYCLGSDAKTLLMAVERDDTFGSVDLYVSFLQPNGKWSRPKNLGNTINTADEEASPFLAADGVTLYFSSGGRCGYGDKDMFITRRLDSTWTKWSEPENIGPALNTTGWDAYYTIPASGHYAYFVSTKNSYGNEDIFRVLLPPSVRPNPVALISGKVLNSKTKQPVAAKIIYETLPDGKEAGVARSNPKTGAYKIVLPSGKKYGFLADAEGFIAINENLDLRHITKYEEIAKDLTLVPIEVGQTVKLNNIFFEFGKYDLLEDSYSELNRVVEFLIENPGIKIEIRGHTCDIGSEYDNKILSTNRAEAVAYYLISKNIPASRLEIKGYGESMPVVPNTSEKNRELNRRVEFLIKK